ncbi:uncharacterized protein LOC130784919 [Actinidia eriantha]|uniref:uncharacterized protein LOC130784919 n=1 Tax=Actinidia eriantha TaxID=165200 RepID=UPI00258B5EB5|nr:uncharacterized protein LOC130784919 [Actinidia eriantha]
MEKEFVVDMANNTASHEILSILKEKNLSNTTGIKSIYNAILKNKSTKWDGLNSVQYVLDQLIKKEYLHNYRTNQDTNEITYILWVHPRSLELSVNFSSVLVIDATYKTNEYRIPLLEVVGITSTMRTYSLMFAYLSNERAEQLTWALGTLKKWVVENGASLPSVFVSDQNLVANLLFSLNWFDLWAPEIYWMDSIPLKIVIASRYNLVLHTFSENVMSCFTHLPLRTPPVPNQERREIAIAHVSNQFVQVFLHPHYPVPPIPTWWWQHSSYEAKGWAARYRTHVHLWYEVIGAPSTPGVEFGGNID